MSEVFIVFPPATSNGLICGRNSFSFCCKEILLGDAAKNVSLLLIRESTEVNYLLRLLKIKSHTSNEENIVISSRIDFSLTLIAQSLSSRTLKLHRSLHLTTVF